MKLERMNIAWDSPEFMNLTVFWRKFVPLEIKRFVNIENIFWMVITPHPLYINDSNSHFQCFLLSKLS